MECDIFQEAQAFQQYVKEFENQISKTLIFNNEDLKILIYSNADYQGLYEKLKKMLIPLKDDLSIYIPKKILNHDDREIVQTCSMSLLSKLLYISIYDTEGILNFWLIDVQRTYLLTLYEHQRWCYTILITVYTSILEQGVLWNPEVNEKTKTLISSYGQNSNLSDVQNVPKIILTSQYHVDNLIKVCLSVLDYIVPQYCNMDVDKGVAIRNIAVQIFREKSIESKSFALKYLRKYYASLACLTESDVETFISVLNSMSIIYKSIPLWKQNLENENSLKNLQVQAQEFVTDFPVNRMKFTNLIDVQHLLAYTTEIIFNLITNYKMYYYSDNPQNEPVNLFSNMLKVVLDDVDYTLETVECLKVLLPLDNPTIINQLIMYLIIAEVQISSNFNSQLWISSSHWKNIHDRTLKDVDQLASSTKEEFLDKLECISSYFTLAFQIEFGITKNHQLHHGTLSNKCKCHTFECNNSLMKFADWNFKHIPLKFFDKLEEMVGKLLSAIENQNVIDAPIVSVTLDIFSCIINLCDNNNSLLNQKMISIVALPFYQTLKKSPHIRKLPWLHNEMKKLPKKLVEFFESQFERKQEIILKMKATSIINLSQFSLQPNCWVLVKSIMESVISQNDIEQKSALYSNFTSFAVNNSEKLQEVLTLYQNFLMELKDVQLTIQPLRDMLCLSGGHLSIFKMQKEYHIYDYKIVCDDCILVSTIYPKSMKSLDIHRHMAFIKDLNAILISSDPFKNAQQNLQISASNLISQSNEFKMKLFSHIPSMITHSKDFITWIQQDKGKSFFEGIYVPNDKFVEELEKNLKDILCNIQKLPFSEKLKLEMFENFFFTNIGELTQLTVSGNKNDKLQSLTIKMNFTYSTIVVDELTMVKCFKIFLLYILRYDSQVKAEASLLALEMAKRNKITLQQLFQWHKTFIMRYVTYIIIANYLAENISLSTSIINLLRYLNISKLRDFLPKTIGTIIAYLLPRAVQSPVIMKSLTDLCGMFGPLDKEQNLSDAIDKNLLEIYHHIYTSHPKNVTENCVKFIEDRIQMNIYKRFASHKKKTVDEVLMFYNKSPEFVAEIFKHSINDRSSSLFSDDDDEEMIESITTRFLGVLIYFEPFLTSNDCERVTKKNILLSLGDIIRLLGDSRISPFCFKIITVLKTAAEQKTFDLSDVCIKVWEILIRNCDVTFLGPILSTVFVSLEAFIDRYPDEVHELYSYLVVSNRNLLSCHISNLFFIEKTRVHSDIKAIITEQLHSQKRDDRDFKSNVTEFIRHMNSENSDFKIQIYCLQYLKELFQNNRDDLNDMICRLTMDPVIEELLHILVKNCKNTTNEMLQLATAECFGELGAIEPTLQQQKYTNQEEFPEEIHDIEFAKLALYQLCRSYQLKNDAKHIDALSLAIQELLKDQKVTKENHDEMEVWKIIPKKMRSQIEPLLTSKYAPKTSEPSDKFPIFWTQLQTAMDWIMRWSGELISRIVEHPSNTKDLLESIKPSMKHNQHITSLFFPYIILHHLEFDSSLIESQNPLRTEIDFIFAVILKREIFEQQHEAKKQKKPLYVKEFDFVPMKVSDQLLKNNMKIEAVKAAKIIFEAFDFLENYRRRGIKPELVRRVNLFLDSFDLEEMAEVNYECGEYARAMIYLENALKKQSGEEFQDKLSFLTQIYVKLENPDSVEGIQALKTTERSLEEKILISNVTGKYQDLAASFERMMQIGEAKIEHIQSMINTYILLDQPQTALVVYEEMIKKIYNSSEKLACDEIKAEPLWRLSRFDELEELISDKTIQKSSNWGLRCGNLLLRFRSEDDQSDINNVNFFDELNTARLAVMNNLMISGSEQTSYGSNYTEVVHLHLINEFEKAGNALNIIKKTNSVDRAMSILKNLFDEWTTRMEVIFKTISIEEQILCFHRIIMNEMKLRLQKIFDSNQVGRINNLIDGEIGNLWIESTKLACKNKMYQQAQMYILNAEQYQPKKLFLEKAEFNWIKGDQNNAFKILELGSKKLLGNRKVESLSDEEKKIYSKGKLMIALYNAEAVNVEPVKNVEMFFEAKIPGAENEKVFLRTAEYMDRHYSKENEVQFIRIGEPKNMFIVIKTYLDSMKYGNEYVFQSMPRFLSIWLDTAAEYGESHGPILAKMNKLVDDSIDSLNLFYFYSAFSQLISRICHPSDSTFNVLKNILVKLVLNYPQQSLWYLIPVLKSQDRKRVNRCQQVLKDFRVEKSQVKGLIQEYNSLIESFMKISNLKVSEKVNIISMKQMAPKEATTITKLKNVILPFEHNLNQVRVMRQKSFKFADNIIKIHKIKDRMDVMTSLQRPKKIAVIGSDGKEYSMLLKSKDDLRIDLRFQEFASVVKQFLYKDLESRHRQLTARTYSVIPLNETCGLIEWIPNLKPYKDLIMKEYFRRNHHPNSVKSIEKKYDGNKKLAFEALCEEYYPVFGDFFRQQYVTPQNFFKARSAYIKTTAVMSIIGYIMGLGDRHGLNILFDIQSGETVHVDCNMLFNRGENLPVPEKVPFRLTHNMIDAMGVLGIEGTFRKSCEIVLRVLQKEKNTLLSYLRPMVYDILLKKNDDWKRNAVGLQDKEKEQTEQESIRNMKNIEMRLKGIVSKYKGSSGIPLSTEGQVNFIINEATDPEYLCVMFQGWMPWM